MKKSLCLTLGACLISIVALYSNANATTFNNGTGGQVSFTITTPGAPTPFTFNPSSNVAMAGVSVATAFQENAYHTAVLNKASGQSFGMASNSNKIWFNDISSTSSYTAPTGSTSATFSGWNSI